MDVHRSSVDAAHGPSLGAGLASDAGRLAYPLDRGCLGATREGARVLEFAGLALVVRARIDP